MRRVLLLFCLFLSLPLGAQLPSAADFTEAGDTLTTLTCEHFGVKSKVSVWRVMRRGSDMDIYFNKELSDYPWRPDDEKWFRQRISEFWPERLRGYRLGKIFCRNLPFDDLLTPGPETARLRITNSPIATIAPGTLLWRIWVCRIPVKVCTAET